MLEKKGQVLVVTLNRPNAANSLNLDTLKKGAILVRDLYYDRSVRVVILTGSGDRVFSAGADLKERKGMSMAQVRQYIQTIRDTFTQIENLPQPVICAMNGSAMGGGMELALACDIRIAVPTAKMGLTETSLGIIPGGGGTQRLPRLVGRGRAKEMIFTAETVDAETALTYGLVNHVVPRKDLMKKAMEIAEKICNNAPIAVTQAKFAVNRGMEMDISSGLSLESAAYEVCIPTTDRVEALEAFLEKRKPDFKGE